MGQIDTNRQVKRGSQNRDAAAMDSLRKLFTEGRLMFGSDLKSQPDRSVRRGKRTTLREDGYSLAAARPPKTCPATSTETTLGGCLLSRHDNRQATV